MEIPETHYARSGDVSIAYQQFGSGPDVIAVAPFAQNVEMMWEDRNIRRVLERMAASTRVTHFDKRGTGLSDRTVGAPTIEERMDDFRAVMDQCEIERATVIGVSEGGPMALVLAATHPERVEKLVLYGTFAAPPWAIDPARSDLEPLVEAWIDVLADNWGTPQSITVASFMPSMLGDEDYRRWSQRYERACLSPKSVRELMELNIRIDVRDVLPLVQAPTLVFHRRDDQVIPLLSGRHLAQHIPGARFVELHGEDHTPWNGDVDEWFAVYEEFVLGGPSAPVEPDRVLATVLFTDIVGSTETAAKLGDRAWHELLDRHDETMRAEITRHRGREIKTTGDGFLATFDSPGRAVRAAKAMTDAARRVGCEIRAGVHTGEVEVRGDDVAGMAVHIGARVAALAGPTEVLVTSTVRDLVIGSELRFDERGEQVLKGVDGTWRILALAG